MMPREERVGANGLQHHVLRWDGGGERIVLMHGFLDLAWSWKWVAEPLAEAGFDVIAFDFRGHGESEWIGAGGYYYFWDYLLDLDELLQKLPAARQGAGGRVHLVGHSMGGIVASLYAALRPERLLSLTSVEGLGPRNLSSLDPVARARDWLDAAERARARPLKAIASLGEVLRRMRVQNPELDDERGLFLAEKATRAVEGGFLFRFDPLHRTRSPQGIDPKTADAMLDAVIVPTLAVVGERGYRPPDEGERLERLGPRAIVEIPDVGHMIHWFAPEALLKAILEHLQRDEVRQAVEGDSSARNH